MRQMGQLVLVEGLVEHVKHAIHCHAVFLEFHFAPDLVGVFRWFLPLFLGRQDVPAVDLAALLPTKKKDLKKRKEQKTTFFVRLVLISLLIPPDHVQLPGDRKACKHRGRYRGRGAGTYAQFVFVCFVSARISRIA